jgi:hypothetical protein
MQALETCRFIEKRHHNRQALRGGIRRIPVARQGRDFRFGREAHRLDPSAFTYSGIPKISPGKPQKRAGTLAGESIDGCVQRKPLDV